MQLANLYDCMNDWTSQTYYLFGGQDVHYFISCRKWLSKQRSNFTIFLYLFQNSLVSSLQPGRAWVTTPLRQVVLSNPKYLSASLLFSAQKGRRYVGDATAQSLEESPGLGTRGTIRDNALPRHCREGKKSTRDAVSEIFKNDSLSGDATKTRIG